MKNTLIALAAAGLVSFGAAAQAGDATAAAEGGLGPKLSGQAPADVVAKLKAYKAGEQVGPMTSMMAPMAAGLSDADMENIAAYVASL